MVVVALFSVDLVESVDLVSVKLVVNCIPKMISINASFFPPISASALRKKNILIQLAIKRAQRGPFRPLLYRAISSITMDHSRMLDPA